jgi:hypothetical protein
MALLARAVSIGVLGITLCAPCSARAQSISDLSQGVQRSSFGPDHRFSGALRGRFAHGGPLRKDRTVAQGRDALWNGALIGAAVGAGTGVAFTHAVRDSDLDFGQYARGAVVFAALGAGAGLGIDALLNRGSSVPPVGQRRVLIVPAAWRDFAGVAATWRW